VGTHAINRALRVSCVLAWLAAASAVTWNVYSVYGAPAGYEVGDSVAAVTALKTGSTPVMVMWLDSRCGPCRDSVNFYRQLTQQSGRDVIVMGPESEEALTRFVRESGLATTTIVATRGEWYGFKATPTLLLIDGARTVRRVWVGRILDRAVETDVLSSLGPQNTPTSRGE
jgi:hypothetical protein